MAPTFVRVDDATLRKTENEVATVLIHLKNLLRFKNQLRSPLLRLPTEIITHIISFIMENMAYSRAWRSIFSTCHRIHSIMCTATGLWWMVDCSWPREACVAFVRSNWDPQVLIAEVHRDPDAKEAVGYWRDRWGFHGHRLHTLRLYGTPSDLAHFS